METKYLNLVYFFLKNPSQGKLIESGVLFKIKFLIYSFFLIVGGSFFIYILNSFLIELDILENNYNINYNVFKKNYEGFVRYLIILFIAPVIEELAFRGFLRFSKFNLIVSSSILTYICLSFFNGGIYRVEVLSIFYGCCSFIIAGIFGYLLLNNNFYNSIKSVFNRKYAYIFYSSGLIFSFLHFLSQKQINFIQIVFCPIIIAPLFIYGVVLGLIRTRLGLVWAIVFHSFLNLIAILF